jgi:purine-binding chemotaxis protein CheW
MIATSQQAEQYVSFWVDGQLLGVPVSAVQEVLNSQNIARTPRSKPEIAGLLNLRGQIVTAVDLRMSLCLPPLGDEKSSMNVVLRFRGESFSLLVDEVGDVFDVSKESILPVPRTLNAHWLKVTTGVVRQESGLFIILDVATVLGLPAS